MPKQSGFDLTIVLDKYGLCNDSSWTNGIPHIVVWWFYITRVIRCRTKCVMRWFTNQTAGEKKGENSKKISQFFPEEDVKDPFRRHKNWLRTGAKSGADLVILAFDTDYNLPRVGQNMGQRSSLKGCVYTTSLGDWIYFQYETTVLRMRSAKLLNKLT